MSTVQDQDQLTGWQRFRRRVPNGFAIIFSLLGLFCALMALIGPLRRGLHPVIYWLDTLTIPVVPNFAYAVFLFLLAAAMTARKQVALWFVVTYMVLVTLADALFLAGGYWEYAFSLVLCAGALVLLLVSHREFYADHPARRVPARDPGADRRARRGDPDRLGTGELAPGTLGPARQPAAVGRQPRLRRTRRRPAVEGHPPHWTRSPSSGCSARWPCSTPRPPCSVRSAGSRAARRRGGPHPRAAGRVRQARLARLLRHPPRQGRRLLPQRQGRRHLPRRGRRLPGQR